MVYDIKTVPEDTPIWCTGFRFDDTKAGIKCEPVFGTFEERSCYSKFHTLSNKTRSKTFSDGANPDCYRFADTYEEAATEYNGMIFAAKYELIKKQEYLEQCLLADKNGSVYNRVSMQ